MYTVPSSLSSSGDKTALVAKACRRLTSVKDKVEDIMLESTKKRNRRDGNVNKEAHGWQCMAASCGSYLIVSEIVANEDSDLSALTVQYWDVNFGVQSASFTYEEDSEEEKSTKTFTSQEKVVQMTVSRDASHVCVLTNRYVYTVPLNSTPMSLATALE